MSYPFPPFKPRTQPMSGSSARMDPPPDYGEGRYRGSGKLDGKVAMPVEQVQNFAKQVPMGRPAQPCELGPVCVMLASDEASYVSGATVAVTGGKPIL